MDLEHCAFLDIETAWPTTRADGQRAPHQITVIGVYRPFFGTMQLVAPRIDRLGLTQLLEGVETVCTYNGERFDLPVIEESLGLRLAERFAHRDLMFDCWARRLKGGLKNVERLLGIYRDTEGVDGVAAMNLWAAYRRGSAEALELLLRYNREDCENLETLARKLGLFETPAAQPELLSAQATLDLATGLPADSEPLP